MIMISFAFLAMALCAVARAQDDGIVKPAVDETIVVGVDGCDWGAALVPLLKLF